MSKFFISRPIVAIHQDAGRSISGVFVAKIVWLH